MIVRHEISSDFADIGRITELAFRDRPYAAGDEQKVIERLRASEALVLSLVAIEAGELIGHIAFSPAELSDGSQPWFALGPVSVVPDQQGKGVGSTLIRKGLGGIRSLGALGCILTGNPAYYHRFGFELTPEHVPSNESEDYFMLKMMGNQQPAGRFSFHRGFYVDE